MKWSWRRTGEKPPRPRHSITRRALLGSTLAAGVASSAILTRDTWTARTFRSVPRIVVSNQATTKLDLAPEQLVHVMQRYVDDYLAPVWGVAARIEWAKTPDPTAWNVMLVDQLDEDAGPAIAYHEFDADAARFPYAFVSVVLAQSDTHYGLSIVTTHELGEMLVNPGINNWSGVSPMTDDPDADMSLWALEVADPVEHLSFKCAGVSVSNFVYPSYFEPWLDGPFDQCEALEQSHQIMGGGYQIVRAQDKVSEIVNIFGAAGPTAKAAHLRCARYLRIMERCK